MKSRFLLAFFVLGLLAVSARAGKPNILVILFDDLGYSDLGCYGGEIETPNMPGAQEKLSTYATDSLRVRSNAAGVINCLR